MKSFLAVAGLLASRSFSVEADSPIAKVIQMLTDLEGKITKDGEASKQEYENFSKWCEDKSRTLSQEITTGNTDIARLQAGIAEDEASINSMNMKIQDLGNEIRIDEADLQAATGIRNKEAEVFGATQAELSQTIDVLQRAIAILEREMKKGGASMLQMKGVESISEVLATMVQATEISNADASKLTALIQSSSDDSDSDVGAPAAAVYKSHSGGILQTLTDLLDKAEQQLASLRTTEEGDIRNFQVLELSLKDEIAYSKKELEEAKKNLAESSESKSTAEGDLAMTTKDLNLDVQAKEDLHHSCMSKAEDYEAETKSRAEELNALAQAKKAIQENTAGANALAYSFVQVASAVKYANVDAVRVVRDLANKHHSAVLAQLAERMEASMRVGGGDDQFAKVKGLIREMIARLEKEADADATEKAFCDKNLAETRATQAEKKAEIEKLTTRIDQMSARSSQCKTEVAELQQALAQLVKYQAELTQMREAEKSTFVTNKADMEQGLEGVKIALKVLNEYYASSNKAHEAAEGAGQGIIGLLEVIESDLSKGLAEMVSDEEVAAAAYDKQTKQNEIEKTTKEQSAKYLEKEAVDLDSNINDLSSDRATEQTQLKAVEEYLAKLEQRCIAKAETFEERKARFEAEIAGLKEAMRILSEEAAALLQRKVNRRLARGFLEGR